MRADLNKLIEEFQTGIKRLDDLTTSQATKIEHLEAELFKSNTSIAQLTMAIKTLNVVTGSNKPTKPIKKLRH